MSGHERRRIMDCTAAKKSGVEAGYEKDLQRGERGNQMERRDNGGGVLLPKWRCKREAAIG